MPAPSQEFVVEVSELDRIAAALPPIAAALRPVITVLADHTPSARPGPEGPPAAVTSAEHAYGLMSDCLAARQRAACDQIDATAQTLREIAAVYRRVDGQG